MRDDLIARAQIEAERHQPERDGGCTCGFSVWSVEHVLIMSMRSVLPDTTPQAQEEGK